jgi:hypothetical protein
MLEALRGLGYSPATALADLIDNSIAAGASTVDVSFVWSGPESYIAIADDGAGMDGPELERAMRLGALNPLDERNARDLGRFGLGLKTASFSQCRRLTVRSIKGSSDSVLRWDLDRLAQSRNEEWLLFEGPQSGSESRLKVTSESAGTCVLWEVLDRIITPGFCDDDFLDLIDRVEQHLSMVFHRYLDGSAPRLTIRLNGRRIQPWDPYLAKHASTWTSPTDQILTGQGVVTVQAHVLPHKDHLRSDEYERAAGPEGWTGQQGFYVYRNERMLVAGSWLGLGSGRSWTKEESHRLARLRVDIPNSMDAAWRIDIRKSVARPPVEVRERLTRLAEDTRARARRIFAHRGEASGGAGEVALAWRATRTASGLRYQVDESHPAIRAVLDDAGPLLKSVKAMLRVIEETVPVQKIWLDTAESKETPVTGFKEAPTSDVVAVLRVMYAGLIRKGMSPQSACDRLRHSEPFNRFPDLVAQLPTDPSFIKEVD